jgi:hypothetical protein
VSIPVDLTLAIFVSSSLSAGAGAFLGSYLKKKGENLATKEDLDDLVEQVRAVTTTTKEIEASISNEVWDRQRQWELKRDAVYSVLQAIAAADDAIVDLVNVLGSEQLNELETFEKLLSLTWAKSYESLENLGQKRALALIICERGLTDVVLDIKKAVQNIMMELHAGKPDAYSLRAAKLGKDMVLAYALGRLELGIAAPSTRQSSESSAAPSKKRRTGERVAGRSRQKQAAFHDFLRLRTVLSGFNNSCKCCGNARWSR